MKKQKSAGRERRSEMRCFKSKESRRAKSRPSVRPPACVFFLSRLGRGAGVAFHRWVAQRPRPPAVRTHLGQVSLRHGWRVSRAAAGPSAPSRRPHRRHRSTGTHRSRTLDALTRACEPTTRHLSHSTT